jgi:UDP-N-acetylglucosamine 1-carboxyvinyltransferase
MLKNFGVIIVRENGTYRLKWENKKAGEVFLEEASVTATEMALIIASSLEKDTVIDDAAAEPHVKDLAEMLGKMGVKIEGAGTNKIKIKGKKSLRGTEHRVMSDYIEGGTLAIAAAITGGDVKINNCEPENYKMIIYYLQSMGVNISCQKNSLIVKPSKLITKKRKFQTRPWPGFPTDLMSPFIVLATQTDGTVLCHDWMYEWRVFFVDDLIQMGANIFIADPHRVIVTGPTKLYGETLFSKDIRAGMSIVLAALAAEGKSEIRNAEMIERGYEKIHERLNALGADIKRIETDGEIS